GDLVGLDAELLDLGEGGDRVAAVQVQRHGPRVGRRGEAGAGGFSLPAGGDAAAAGQAEGPASTAAVGLSLLAVQEGGERAGRDQAAKRRAESVLQELQSLQLALLRDGPDPVALARLAALQSGEEAADPILRDAVAAILLRAKVELARRGWKGGVSGA
ncbi:hypothetical protein CKO45_20485, partial [Paracraurococcus ruber]|nr:hypothetical protein [Paracraurococcus ruber]